MAFTPSERIAAILRKLPNGPGVYIHKDKDGRVLYVGKAVNLRQRVRSYFYKSVSDSKTIRLRLKVEDIETITTDTELEALLLEMTLIKKHRPQFNVRMKDDKRYPYIKVHWGDPFPKVTVTRRMKRDGARYFGPYTSVWAVHQTLDLLRKIFPYLTCDRTITGNDERACLYFDIRLCNAPCVGNVDQAGYRLMIRQLMDFLNGRTEEIADSIGQKMHQVALALDFEAAAQYRDQLKAIQHVVSQQKVISAASTDQDVIAFAREDDDACVQVFFIRHGKLIGREYFLLEGTEGASEAEVLQEFLTQFYDDAAHVPKEVLLPEDIEEANVIEQWLRQKRTSKVSLRVPRRGKKRELVKMAATNAADTLSTLRQQWSADRSKHVTALAELQESLGLPTPPNRIECYDISHTQGRHVVGSMVVFQQGAASKRDYRTFNVRTVENDDPGAMKEVVGRRLRRYSDSLAGELHNANDIGRKKDASWSILPDLLLVDGGKGQLSAVLQALDEMDLLSEVTVAALAKREEEIFLPGRDEPVILPERSQALYLVQRIRDEAHRFANLGHRRRRSKVGIASILDSVPGVGPQRRKLLLGHFGSLDDIRAATVEELASVPGIPFHVAEAVKMHLG